MQHLPALSVQKMGVQLCCLEMPMKYTVEEICSSMENSTTLSHGGLQCSCCVEISKVEVKQSMQHMEQLSIGKWSITLETDCHSEK